MKSLPPGQKEIDIFPRFGLPKYAKRFPSDMDNIHISIGGDVEEFEVSDALNTLKRVDQRSDFHCVTTWSKLGLDWSGYRFSDFFNQLILPKLSKDVSFVVMKAQDGYKTSMLLEDLMRDNVLLADQLNGQGLNLEHGAPIRIVVPDHYGYKNLKHINRLEFYAKKQKVKQGILSFMDHPRARVNKEERATTGPGLFFRYLYKIGIQGTIKDFANAAQEYRAQRKHKN